MFLTLYAFAIMLFILLLYYAVTGWSQPITNGQMLLTLGISATVAGLTRAGRT